MLKKEKASTADALEISVELASGVNNTKEKQMDNEIVEAEDWPKGLYMIFLKTETDAMMGKVIGLTKTTALIHPWDFMFGGVDEELTIGVLLADYKEFFAFDDVWDMDDYFEKHHWNLMLDKNIKPGTIV
jgi:hypothetical protein